MANDLGVGAWASVIVQVVGDRAGRALVRLPNGSKTAIALDDLHATIVEYTPARRSSDELGPGDVYLDCTSRPVLCTWRDGDRVGGISLVDATRDRSCSIADCDVRVVEIAAAVDVIDRL
jgi:hypothetical protein